MKTKLLTVALLCLFAINDAMAQEKGNFRAGLGLVIGTNLDLMQVAQNWALAFLLLSNICLQMLLVVM